MHTRRKVCAKGVCVFLLFGRVVGLCKIRHSLCLHTHTNTPSETLLSLCVCVCARARARERERERELATQYPNLKNSNPSTHAHTQKRGEGHLLLFLVCVRGVRGFRCEYIGETCIPEVRKKKRCKRRGRYGRSCRWRRLVEE
jgi:hypothetical protein